VGGAAAVAAPDADPRAILSRGRWKSDAVSVYLRVSRPCHLELGRALP
jgi:hypothetical protein